MKNKNLARLMMVVSLAVAFAVVAATPLMATTLELATATGTNFSADATQLDANLLINTPTIVNPSVPTSFTGTSIAYTSEVPAPDPSFGLASPGAAVPIGNTITNGSGEYSSGWYLVGSFALPSSASTGVFTISGTFTADDAGVVYLNGYAIGTGVWGSSTTFSYTYTGIGQNDLNFNGTNYLVVSDQNSIPKYAGVELDATVTYGVTPEPGTLLLLGSGLVGMAGMVRRKMGSRA